jgi:uncharacterized OB-fold protein
VSKPFSRPRPALDSETRPYWEAAGRGELVIQRCGACGVLRHRPRALCPACLSDDVSFVRASGRGRVHTYTVTHQNQAPPFRDALPYVLAYVDLDEGVRLLTNIVGCRPEEVSVGLPVQVEFADRADDIAIPLFRPA